MPYSICLYGNLLGVMEHKNLLLFTALHATDENIYNIVGDYRDQESVLRGYKNEQIVVVHGFEFEKSTFSTSPLATLWKSNSSINIILFYCYSSTCPKPEWPFDKIIECISAPPPNPQKPVGLLTRLSSVFKK